MRVLVMSGGGAKGAYQAGAALHLLADLGISYDGFCGASVGAINAAFLAQFEKRHEVEAATQLDMLWRGLSTPRVYRKWYHGLLWYLPVLWKPSLFDSSPLHEFLRSNLSARRLRDSGKLLSVGAVSKSTGEYGIWHGTDPDIVDGVLSSSAFPLFLTPIETRNDVWQDAGARETTPLADAIHLGATEIDVLCCSPLKVRARAPRLGHAIDNGLQELDVAFSEIERGDIAAAQLWNALAAAKHPLALRRGRREVKLRVLRPTQELLRNPLDFSPSKIYRNLKLGYEDARRMVW